MPELNTEVRCFDSTMLGAPSLNGLVGSLIAVLDACLVSGFAPVTASSLVVASGIATLTVLTGHGFPMVGGAGPVLRITGATPSGLNADWRVASVPHHTTLTFACPGVADGAASGTITVKRAPAGWTKPFEDLGRAAYLMNPVNGNPHYLQVIDDATVTTTANGRWAKWTGYESMTDVNNGLGAFPTVAQSGTGLSVSKSDASNDLARPWALVADDRLFYLTTLWNQVSFPDRGSGYAFGKTGSLRVPDGYDTLISANNANMNTLPAYPVHFNEFVNVGAYNATQNGRYLARSHTQLGSSAGAGFIAAPGPCSYMGYGGFGYPYTLTNGMLISPVGLSANSLIRNSALPGLYYPQHNAPLAHNDTLELVAGLEGKTLRCLALAYSSHPAQCLIDITGPWIR
jgi:hypothetical protein